MTSFHIFRRIAALTALLLCLTQIRSLATISVTAASATICSNYASTGATPRWTTLGTMTVKEGANADLGNTTGYWTVTLVLVPPTGWQFNSAVTPSRAYTTGKNITSVTISSVTSSSMTVVVAGYGKNYRDQFTITGLQVQPTSTTAASGNIHPSSISGTATGISTSKNFGTLTRSTATSGTASLSIAASPSGTVCAGTSITFSTTPTNGGTSPMYQWKVNGTAVSGATASTYTTTSLTNGSTVQCVLYSSSCISSPTANSNTLTMSINAVPNTSSFTSPSATSPCIGFASTVTVNSTSLGSGTFTASYDLTGANSATATATLTMGSSTGTFTIPASALGNSGATTVTINSLTNASGCSTTLSGSNTASFTVNAEPTAVTASGSGTFCGSTTITASNGGSGTIYYQGTTANGTSTTTASSSQVVSATDVYYFRAQSSAGCWSDEDSVSVTIDPLPTTVTVTGGGTYCGSTTINASNGSSGTIYFQGTTSGGTSTATPSTSQVITTSGTYYFRALSSAGCWGNEGSASIVVNPSPASIAGTPNTCTGSATTLSDATGGGTWSSSNTSIATVTSGGVVSGIAAGTANITYALGTGCADIETVTVSATPSAISGASSVCSGQSITYTNTSAYGVWTSNNTSVATIGSTTGILTGVANGTATITYSTGCGTAATKTVTVGNSPITGTLTVCTSATTALSDAIPGGTWSSANTGIATVNSSTGVVTGVANGTATISYASGSCTSTAVVTVNVSPATISGTANACVASTRTLTDATPYGTWSSGTTSVATVGSTGIVTGVSAGTATISYSTGCGTAATKIFTVNPLPSAITGTLNVCVSSTTTLGNVTTGGTWTSSNTSVATIGSATGIATGIAAGTATIVYTLPTGCTATATLTVNALPSAISGTRTVCAGSTTSLTDPTTGGTWSSSNTSVATVNSTSGSVTGVAAGNATITYTLTTGCAATAIVTVNALPPTISGTASTCVSSTTTLSSSGGGTWTSSNTAIATVGVTSGTVTGVATGNANITYTLSTGCSVSRQVTINALPGAISGTRVVCVSATTTLSNSGGGSWASSNAGIATIGSTTGIVTGVAAGNATITYTLPTGCQATAGVTVNPLPAAGSITGVLTVCEVDTTTLSDATTGGTWTSNDTTIATVDSMMGEVLGGSAGVTTITYTVTTSCGTAYTTAIVTVNPLPDPGTFTGNTNVCAGATTTLGSTVSGGVWSSDDLSIATVGSSSGIVTGVAAGAVTITYEVTNGCGTDENDTTVNVNPLPSTISGTRTVCVGATRTLTSSSGGTWSSSNSGIAAVGSTTGVVTGVAAGNATITYMLASGCYVTAIVTVNAQPSAISGTLAVCTGSTTSLSSTSGGTWSSGSTSVATIGSGTGVVSPVSAGTSVISYTFSTGCAVGATVTVRAAPALSSASNNGPICAGATLNLNANSPTNVTAYSWAGPVSITGGTTAAASVPSATTSASGTYTVTVTNISGAGCSVNYTTAATVNATPTAAPSSNAPICTGGTVSLAANPSGSTNTYTWSGANLSSTTAQNPTATPTVTTTYSLTVTYAGGYPGCAPGTVYTTTVTVNTIPTASPTNNGPVCSGNTVTLTANPSGSTNTYAWSGANLSSSTAQNPTATPTVTSTYSLTVSYGTGRPGCSPSTVYTTTVTVHAIGRWLGAVDTNWGTNANWCGNVPTATTNVVIPGSITNYPAITTGTYPSNSITIQSGASLRINGGVLQIAGSIANSGTFTATSGEVQMNGSSAQSIPAGTFSSNTIKNLTINNSAGVSLGGALNISGILKVASGTFSTGGYITLLSTASQTALIDGSGSGSVSGNVTMQRYLDSSFGYRYISSPFQAATLSQLSGYINLSASFPNFYGYDENVNYAGWVIDTAIADTLKPMRGYAANFGTSHAASTFQLTGAVNNGSMSYTLYNHNQTYTQGFNFVGNPYPSPIDWNASSGWTKTNIDNAVYYFNHGDTNRYYGRYSSYISGVSSDGIANNVIPAMQGFFVHVSSGSYPVTATLGFGNSVRTTALNPKYHRQASGTNRPLLRIAAGFKGGTHSDPAVIYFDDQATDNFDSQLDALKLMNTDVSVPSLYSLSKDSRNLSIQSLPVLNDSLTSIPLGLNLELDGTIAFGARDIENIPADQHIWLFDAAGGKVQDLRVATYEVPLASGKYTDRFYLVFSKSDMAIPGNGALNAYTSGSSIFVFLLMGEAEVTITNLAGQVVGSQHIGGNGYHEIRSTLASGVYIVTMQSAMGKQSKKVFLGNQ